MSDGSIPSVISYGFPTSGTFATGLTEATGWSAYTSAQKAAVREIMQTWDELIAPSFVEATSTPDNADIKFSNSTTGVSFAHAYYPGMANYSSDKISGSVWTNPAYNSGTNNLVTPTKGIYGYQTLLHEIGHAMGLDHAGNYNGGSPAYGNTSTGWLYAEDSHQYSIMSYFSASNTGANWGGKYAQTPMVYDILAIQQIYGADYTTRATDTTYGFNSNTGGQIFDFTKNASPILTIWDGNGIDTIDLSGWSSASTLSLVAGSYSSVNGMTKNLAIAYDVDIENATGGAGNDTITGNDLDNVLSGNGGSDIIHGADGDDTIDGGAGNDTLNGGAGDDTLVGGAGIDTLIGGAGDDLIYFNSLDNLSGLDGGAGFDTLLQIGVYSAFDLLLHNFERMLVKYTDTAALNWSEQIEYYGTSGELYQLDVAFDDSTSSVTEFDISDLWSWSERTRTYDANGDLVSEVIVPDTGAPPTNTAPTNIALSSSSVAENKANGSVVGALSTVDPDAGDSFTYALLNDAGGRFALSGGNIVVADGSLLDYEAATSHDISVKVTDSAGNTLTKILTIGVTDVIETVEPVVINGTSAGEVIYGTATEDIINGNGGRDELFGQGDNDVLDGGSGVDRLHGGSGEDHLCGSSGADKLIGGSGADVLDGGKNADTGSYNSSDEAVIVNLSTGLGDGGDATGDTLISIENLIGSQNGDTFIGNKSNNCLEGRDGDDILSGQNGKDKIIGGVGSDSLTGGGGDDKFIYEATTEGGDIITDFSSGGSGGNDRFVFDGAAFGGLSRGKLAADMFQSSTSDTATTADVRFMYETDTGILRFDDDGSGQHGAIIIATLQPGATLVLSDFQIT